MAHAPTCDKEYDLGCFCLLTNKVKTRVKLVNVLQLLQHEHKSLA